MLYIWVLHYSDWESFPETKVVILGKELQNKLTVSLMELLTKGEVDHTLDLPLCRYHPRMKSPWDESQYLNIFEYNPKTVSNLTKCSYIQVNVK